MLVSRYSLSQVEGHSRAASELLAQLNDDPRLAKLRQQLADSQGVDVDELGRLREGVLENLNMFRPRSFAGQSQHLSVGFAPHCTHLLPPESGHAENIEVSLDFLAPDKAAPAMPTVVLRHRFAGDDLDEASAPRVSCVADGTPSSTAGGSRSKYACCDELMSLPEAVAREAIESAVLWISKLQRGRVPLLQQGGKISVRFRLDRGGSFPQASGQWFTLDVCLPPRTGTAAGTAKFNASKKENLN